MQQNPKYLLEMLDFLEKNKDYEQVAMVMKKHKWKQQKMRTFLSKLIYEVA